MSADLHAMPVDQQSAHGSVTLGSSAGDEHAHTDATNDLFVFGHSAGMTDLHGESGSNWTSVVELDVSGDAHAATAGDWTHQIDTPEHGGAGGPADGVNTTPPPDDPHHPHPGDNNHDPIQW